VFGAQRRVEAGLPAVGKVSMDVRDEPSVTDGVQTVLQEDGRVGAVINNAGQGLMGAVGETAVPEAKGQVEADLLGVLRVCREVLPIMRQQGSGHIVNISSLAGLVGLPFSGFYSASKFALEGLSESLRLETKRFGIRVVLVEPGDFSSNFPAKRRLT